MNPSVQNAIYPLTPMKISRRSSLKNAASSWLSMRLTIAQADTVRATGWAE